MNFPELRIQNSYKADILKYLNQISHLGNGPTIGLEKLSAPFRRLLALCPCLYSQIGIKVTPSAIVHLCEITLSAPIDSSNVNDAFEIQHPDKPERPYLYPPAVSGADGGSIMEELCSETLNNHDIPLATIDKDKWPAWRSRCHINLNSGRYRDLKLYGDILVPAAPHNILISVKSQAARERFVVSGNRLESVGFGFFNEPNEFWTANRMNLLKRWGFSAVYMPVETLEKIMDHLSSKGTSDQAININGNPLYRPLEDFGKDIFRVAGRLSIDL